MEENQILAKIIKLDDGYLVVDTDGTVGPVCEKVTVDGYLCLSKNAANRKYYNKKNLDKHFDETDEPIGLCYKESRVFGSVGNKIPNEKLIAYLSDEERAEYLAIIDRAKAAKEAAKVKPKTELEKAQEKLAKAQAAYEKLLNSQG